MVASLGAWQPLSTTRQAPTEIRRRCWGSGTRWLGLFCSGLVPQVVAAVSTRMLLQIVLVVSLRAVPRTRRLDRGRDRPPPLARSLDPRLHLLRSGPLLG